MKNKLPAYAWGHAIMHITTLICIQLTTYYEYSPSQFVLEKQPSVFNLRTFGCIVYEPITPTQLTKMGSQQRLEIFVGLDFVYYKIY